MNRATKNHQHTLPAPQPGQVSWKTTEPPGATTSPEPESLPPKAVSFTWAHTRLPDSPPKISKVTPAVDQAVMMIRSDADRQSVLAFCRQNNPGQPVVLIRTPDTLQQHQLLRTVVCSPEQGLSVTSGRLFNDQPITLVPDLTEMTPSQIASLNDLLDTPPEWEDQQLSEQVRRICLVKPNILTAGPCQPGPDCLRRLKKLSIEHRGWAEAIGSLKSALPATVVSNTDYLAARVEPVPGPPDPGECCDFNATDHWRNLLFGDLALDNQGQIYFQTGQLAGLEKGACLTLVDAPWESLEFTDALATALREGGFEANNQWVPLPEGLQLFRQETGADQLVALQKRLVQGPNSFSAELSFVCVNGTTLESALNNSQISAGVPRTVDTLQELLEESQQLCITGPLNQRQWLGLLRRLGKLEPRPTIIDLSQCQQLPPLPGQVRCQLYQHRVTALNHIPREGALIYRVTGAEQWQSLWQNLSMVSQKTFRFAQRDTPLLEAVKNGTPVILDGLHRLPKMVAQVDSLLASPPYLWLNGEKITLPQANITLLWPESETTTCPALWQSRINPAQPAGTTHSANGWPKILERLPPSLGNIYPAQPPWLSLDFPVLLEQQIEREQLADRAPTKLPIHSRQALHTLIAKPYRGDRELYGYLKTMIAQNYPDDPSEPRADQDALVAWLKHYPDVDRKELERQVWSLARHCPVTVFGARLKPYPDVPQPELLDTLAGYLVGSVPQDLQPELAARLGIKTDAIKTKEHFFSGRRRALLRDALLVAGEHRRPTKTPISQQVQQLDQQIEAALDGPWERAATAIDQILKTALSPLLLDQNFADLPQALLDGHGLSRLRQQRRLQRLADRVQNFPLVHLRGESGAGKSHMARAVVAQLSLGEPLVLSLGPQTQASDLYGSQQPQELIDEDTCTGFEPGPLLQWAQERNPPVLILENANLAPEGLLAPLAALTEKPPVLQYQGRVYQLTPNHRVLTTGNLDGPPMDRTLQGVMLTLFYRPLSLDTLEELMITPALPKGWPRALKGETVNTVITLYQQFNQLLPSSLTPSDLQDLLAHIRLTLSFVPSDQEISPEQCHALVWQAFDQALTSLVPAGQQPRLRTLEDWYQTHFPGDRTILQPQEQAFDRFHRTLRQNFPQVDLDAAPVIKLVHCYWLFLNKQQQNSIGGRCALIVEGPAGWGKDLLLDCVLHQWEAEHPPGVHRAFIHTSAKPCRWGELVTVVKQAIERGQKLAISELNLLPSHALEGLVNHLFSQPQKAGFALLATVNPPSFGGREPFTPGLNSRANRWQLEPLSATELTGLLQRRGHDLPLAQWLTCRFVLVNEALTSKANVRLTLDDLLRLANQLQTATVDQWPDLFANGCALELQALLWSAEQMEQQVTQNEEPENHARALRERSLSRLINRQQPQPVLVHLLDGEDAPRWEASSRTLMLPNTGSTDELLHIADQIQKGEPTPTGELGDGKITGPTEFKVTQYFAHNNPSSDAYRLNLSELMITNGDVSKKIIPCDRGGVEPLDTPDWSWAPLAPGQYYGCDTLSLCHHRWQRLPGLSAGDQLVRIRSRSAKPLTLAIARGKETGQLLVKLADTAGLHTSSAKKAPIRTTTLDFVIEPNSVVRNILPVAEEPVVLIDNGYDPVIKRRLQSEIFSPQARVNQACQELQKLWRITSVAGRLSALVRWCREFRSDRDVPGQGIELLINMIKAKQGVCRHRCQIFYLLAAYMGVPVRIVSNDVHCYVEINLNNGGYWQGVSLGGGEDDADTIVINPVDFLPLEPADTCEQYSSSASRPATVPPAPQPQKRSTITTMLELNHLCLDAEEEEEDKEKTWQYVQNVIANNPKATCRYFLGDRLPGVDRLCSAGYPIPEIMFAAFKSCHNKSKALAWSYASAFLEKMASLYTGGLMQKSCYLAIIGELLEQHWDWSTDEHTDQVLPFLEQLTHDPRWQVWAEKRLADFYRSLAVARAWPQNTSLPPAQNKLDLAGHSKTLLATLQQTAIDRQWSYISQGQSPDILRMVRQQAPFPFCQEGLKMRQGVFIPFLRKCYSPNQATLEHLKNYGLYTDLDLDNLLNSNYQSWLTKLGQEWNWQCIIPPLADTRAGCYPISTQAFTSYMCPHLREDRLKQFFVPPQAVIIPGPLLDLGYQEFVQSMDRQRLLTALQGMPQIYRCTQCNYETRVEANLQRHTAIHYLGEC